MAKVSARPRYRGSLSRFLRLKVQQEMAWGCGYASRSLKNMAAQSWFVLAHASRTEQHFPLFCQCLPNGSISETMVHYEFIENRRITNSGSFEKLVFIHAKRH